MACLYFNNLIIVNNILTDSNGNLKYVCVNPTEKIFKFINSTGKIEKDIAGHKITNIILDDNIYNNFFRKIVSIHLPDGLDKTTYDNVRDLLCFNGDRTIFKNELVILTSL